MKVLVSRTKEETETAHGPEIAGGERAEGCIAAKLQPAWRKGTRKSLWKSGLRPWSGSGEAELALWGPVQAKPGPVQGGAAASRCW